MAEFEKSNWAEPDFGRKFVESADIIIVQRKRSHTVMQSFFRHHFMRTNRRIDLLDLGCGDGILTYRLKETGHPISATLIDGSGEMLKRARERLKDYTDIATVHASFQDVMGGKAVEQDFDFIVSSLAIHHLDMNEKTELFRWVYAHLKNNGSFMNIDVVLAPNDDLEEWYLALWQEWISERKMATGITGDIYDDTMRRYKDNRDNKPDRLDAQIETMKSIGFHDVDCYYKYGVFAIYGGRK